MGINKKLFIIIIIFPSLMSSKLSATQNSYMINLFQVLQHQVDLSPITLAWDFNTHPCSWEGVTCNNIIADTVTTLNFSGLHLYDSSFISVACQIHSLEVLDVSGNYLLSIPNEFVTRCGKLPRLKSVNFSRNGISGDLPIFDNKSFTKLESLDLSHNLLSGSIPPSISQLTHLRHLNLQDNSFTDSTPRDISRPPVTTGCNVAKGGDTETESKDNNFYIVLWVSIGLGFSSGFWGVCGTLVLNDARRHACFNFVDTIFNRIYVTVAIHVAKFKRNNTQA